MIENPATRPILSGFFPTAFEILRHPRFFFRRLPVNSGYRRPLAFMALALVLDGLYNLILSRWPWLSLPETPGLTAAQEAAMNYIALALMPFLLLGFGRLFGGKGGFQGAVAVTAYSCAAMILPPVAWLGYVFGFYGLALIFIGLQERFGLTVKRAVFASLLFFMALCAGSAVAVLFLFRFLRTVPGLPAWLAG